MTNQEYNIKWKHLWSQKDIITYIKRNSMTNQEYKIKWMHLWSQNNTRDIKKAEKAFNFEFKDLLLNAVMDIEELPVLIHSTSISNIYPLDVVQLMGNEKFNEMNDNIIPSVIEGESWEEVVSREIDLALNEI